MTAARVEAVAFMGADEMARLSEGGVSEVSCWSMDPADTPLYTPAAVAALMRQMVPEAAVYNEMTRLWQWCAAPGVVASFRNAPAASAWNLCRERQLALIARWESEKGEGE